VKIVMLVARSTGGIGTHAVELTEELRRLGEQVVIVTDPLTATSFGLTDARLWWPGRGSGKGASLRNLWRLRRLIAASDIVHAHGHQAGAVAALVALGAPTPLVVSQHNAVLATGGVRALVSRALQRLVARRAALVTGASTDLVVEARRHGARKARLAPVPSPRVPRLLALEPLDEAARHQLAGALLELRSVKDRGGQGSGDPSDSVGSQVMPQVVEAGEGPAGASARTGGPHLVVTIARIAPQKDLETLIEAASLTQHWRDSAPAEARGLPGTGPAESLTQHLRESAPVGPASVLWVVVGGGDEPLRERLVGRAHALGAPVHFVGPQDDPERWLRAADVFVLTSRWEARALVVQEAMAAGVPVVASDVGGLRDLLQGVGTLVPGGDPAQVWASVERYLRDPAARHTASLAGRERAASWDDGKATARRWREWYAGLSRMT
jgi:glycosyltransferase involved in cell wall biosynthesis